MVYETEEDVDEEEDKDSFLDAEPSPISSDEEGLARVVPAEILQERQLQTGALDETDPDILVERELQNVETQRPFIRLHLTPS